MTSTPSFRDVEKLSAYLDGQLKPSERARLESRLQTDPELASILKELRQTRGLLRQLPKRRAPRNFTLTPKMVGQKPPLPRTYPAFRFATALATLLLFFSFAANSIAPSLATAPYPYGRGGGGGGAEEEPQVLMESVTEEPAMEEPAAPATQELFATPAPPDAQDSVPAEPTAQASEKSGVQEAPSGETSAMEMLEQESDRSPVRPISIPVQIMLAVTAAVSGLVAFILRYTAVRKWRAKAR